MLLQSGMAIQNGGCCGELSCHKSSSIDVGLASNANGAEERCSHSYQFVHLSLAEYCGCPLYDGHGW